MKISIQSAILVSCLLCSVEASGSGSPSRTTGHYVSRAEKARLNGSPSPTAGLLANLDHRYGSFETQERAHSPLHLTEEERIENLSNKVNELEALSRSSISSSGSTNSLTSLNSLEPRSRASSTASTASNVSTDSGRSYSSGGSPADNMTKWQSNGLKGKTSQEMKLILAHGSSNFYDFLKHINLSHSQVKFENEEQYTEFMKIVDEHIGVLELRQKNLGRSLTSKENEKKNAIKEHEDEEAKRKLSITHKLATVLRLESKENKAIRKKQEKEAFSAKIDSLDREIAHEKGKLAEVSERIGILKGFQVYCSDDNKCRKLPGFRFFS